MSGWLCKLSRAGMLLLLVVSICLGGYSSLLSHRLELARKQMSEQEKTMAQQSGLISTLQEQDRKNRALAAEQLRREQQLRQRGERYQRELREALKNDKCGNSLMPRAVINLLQQNAATGTTTGRAVTP